MEDRIDSGLIKERLHHLRERISELGVDPATVKIVGVTKTFGQDVVRAAMGAGIDALGENYAQEAVAKYNELRADAPIASTAPQWHFIGRLQRNKVRLLAPFIDLWQSVDSVALVDEIGRRAPRASVLIQVDLAGEPGRGGCAWHEIAGIADRAGQAGLVVKGLMGVAPHGSPQDARPGFRRLVGEADRHELAIRSIGMSADYEVAVSEGSTMIRLGSGLFGPRPPRQAR